jgi:hypothetical protein
MSYVTSKTLVFVEVTGIGAIEILNLVECLIHTHASGYNVSGIKGIWNSGCILLEKMTCF